MGTVINKIIHAFYILTANNKELAGFAGKSGATKLLVKMSFLTEPLTRYQD